MGKQIKIPNFTRREIEFFLRECNFTEQETEMFNLRNKDYTLEQAAEEMNISCKTAYRINKRVKTKIIKVLSYDD